MDDLGPITPGRPLGMSVVPIVQESDGLCEVEGSMPNEGLRDFCVSEVVIIDEI